MPPNRRRPAGYLLLGMVVALSGLLSLNLLAAGVSDPPSASHDPRYAVNQSRFAATSVSLATGVPAWPRSIAVDETTGLAYLADGDRGTVTIVAGPVWVDSIPVGQAASDVAVDPGTGYVYASVPDPYAISAGYIAVIRGGGVVTQVAAGGRPGPLAVDLRRNRAYVGVETGGILDQVLVLQQDRLVNVISTPPGIVALDVDPERGRAYIVTKNFPRLAVIEGSTISAPLVPLDDVGTPRALAVDPTSGLVYVAGQSPFRPTGTVLVISDTQQIARLPVGPDPRHLAVDAQRGLVYVTNAGDDTLSVISGGGVINTIPVGPKPDWVVVDPVSDYVYVSNAGDGTTTVLSGQQVVATLTAGGGALAVDSASEIAYLAGNGLAVAQRAGLLGRLPIAAMPARVAVNPETGLAYVCNQGSASLDVLSEGEVVATLPLGNRPLEIAADPISGWVYVAGDAWLGAIQGATLQATVPITARQVEVDPLRGLAYAAGYQVYVISGAEIVGAVPLGQPPRAVAVNRDTGLAYATAGGNEDGFVAVISGTQRIGTIDVGGAPGELVVDPVRDRVIVLHPELGRLSVIRGMQRQFPNIFLPRPALGAAVNPLTGDVYVATRGPLVLVQGLDGSVIDLGLEALAVAVDVEQALAYVTTRDGQVAIFEGPDVVGVLPAGHRPLDMAVDSRTGRVFVANYGSDTITIVEGRSLRRLFLPLLGRDMRQ